MWKKLCGALAALTIVLAPAPAGAEDADPALWVIRDEDTTIYLFGTVHVMKPGLSWFDEAVKTAFDASDELVLETIEPPPAELQEIVARIARRKDGRTLSETLTSERRADLARALGGIGLPADAFDRFEPWFATVMIAGRMLPKLGYDPALGAEHTLTEAARREGKQLSELETPEKQLGFFKGAAPDLQLTFLGYMLDNLDKVGARADSVVALWSRGNPDAVGDAVNEELSQAPALAKRLLFDRNADWARWIAHRMYQPGTVFVAVGAGHLGGKGNVRELLAERGLEVERVSY